MQAMHVIVNFEDGWAHHALRALEEHVVSKSGRGDELH